MSAAPKIISKISLAEYFEGEVEASVRHEFVHGKVYAMAGANETHNRISLNIGSFLDDAMASGPCRPFVADMKLRVRQGAADNVYYPDVFVTCDPTDDDPIAKEKPEVIFEVLSNSTEGIDRREKFAAYTGIPSLDAYVLVSQKRHEVTVFRRENDWAAEIITDPQATLSLPHLKLDLPLARIYRNADFSKADPPSDIELS